jgi:hypothetical protein
VNHWSFFRPPWSLGSCRRSLSRGKLALVCHTAVDEKAQDGHRVQVQGGPLRAKASRCPPKLGKRSIKYAAGQAVACGFQQQFIALTTPATTRAFPTMMAARVTIVRFVNAGDHSVGEHLHDQPAGLGANCGSVARLPNPADAGYYCTRNHVPSRFIGRKGKYFARLRATACPAQRLDG